MIIEKSAQNMEVVPHYTVGKHVSAYRRHKLEGTQWGSRKQVWARTDNAAEKFGQDVQIGMAAIMSPLFTVGGIIDGHVSVWALGVASWLFSWSIIGTQTQMFQAKYANARIARARIDKLKLYALEGPVVDALGMRLSCAEASRMIDWLDQDISRELHQAFVNYHDRYDLALETIDAVEASTIDSGTKLAKLAMLHNKAAGFVDEAVVTIRGIFAEHDAAAELEELETRELVESKRFAELEVAKINQTFANESLLKQVDYVLSL